MDIRVHVQGFRTPVFGPECLLLRFSASDRERAFRAGAKALHYYLAAQGVAGTRVVLDDREPVPDARSGKLRQVIVEARELRDEGAKAPLATPDEARRDRISSQRAAGRTHGHHP